MEMETIYMYICVYAYLCVHNIVHNVFKNSSFAN